MNFFEKTYIELHFFYKLLRTKKHIDSIIFFDSVEKQIKIETNRLADSILNSKVESEQDYILRRYLSLNRAVNHIREDRQVFLFRRASISECINANTMPMVIGKGEPNWFYFLEVYEYKFVLLLNFTKRTGQVLLMARTSKNGISLRKALGNASKRANTFLKYQEK